MKRKSDSDAPDKIAFPGVAKAPITTQLRRWSEYLREDGYSYIANEVNIFGQSLDPFPHSAAVEVDQANAEAATLAKTLAAAQSMIEESKLRRELVQKLVSKCVMEKSFLGVFVSQHPNYITYGVKKVAQSIDAVFKAKVSATPRELKRKIDAEYRAIKMKANQSLSEYVEDFKDIWRYRNSVYEEADAISEADAVKDFLATLSPMYDGYVNQLRLGEVSNRKGDKTPAFEYPTTFVDACLVINDWTLIMSIDESKSTTKRNYATLEHGEKSQADLPAKLSPTHKFYKRSGYCLLGSKLKPSDKPSNFQYGPCPICAKNGYEGSHFKYFHDEVVKKLKEKRLKRQPDANEGEKKKVGKKGKNSKNRINATTNEAKDDKPEKEKTKDSKKKEEPITRKDFQALGDSIKEAMVSLTKAVTEK